MKIFCKCGSCQSKIHLLSSAKTKYEFARSRGAIFIVTCGLCSSQSQIQINSTYAESTKSAAPVPGVAIGTVVGIIAGPLGMLIGAAVGGAIGGGVRYSDAEDVRIYNNSYLN